MQQIHQQIPQINQPRRNTFGIKPKFAVAIFDYDAQVPEDLDIKERDLLEILNDNGNWWKAKNQRTGKIGLMPSNYVRLLE